MEAMLEVFTCPICHELANGAVTTMCCYQVYCKSCISALKPPMYCPSCRSDNRKVKYQDAIAIQRGLDRLPVTCPNACETTLTRGDLKLHTSSTCPKRILKCPCPTCNAPPMTANLIAAHIASEHSNILVAYASRLFEDTSKDAASPVDLRIDTLTNSIDRTSRLGTSGKMYCGRRADIPGTDGYCGPTKGPQCNACIILDKLASTWYKEIDTQRAKISAKSLNKPEIGNTNL